MEVKALPKSKRKCAGFGKWLAFRCSRIALLGCSKLEVSHEHIFTSSWLSVDSRVLVADIVALGNVGVVEKGESDK
ncbi:hypothetical protein VNO80_25348 [Phaseolus coccineus]|uniref:Uncharacterized protein n=1 Tax=Phaseolus coccineus TaxID=3886 RepID=A0AAN9LZ19_PHACN